MSKVVYGIRHAQGWHNILFSSLQEKAYTNFKDATLTIKGMEQAASAETPDGIQIVYVSPLVRTLQTSQIMFPNVKTIALECLKEYPQHTQQCNRRSSRSLLQVLFPNVDFSDLIEEESVWPGTVSCDVNLEIFKNIVAQSSYSKIAVVTNSTWLKY